MQFPLISLAFFAIARSVTGLESNGKDTIKVRRYGSLRPEFVKEECNRPGAVCLFEVTRPSRAVIHSNTIRYKESVHRDDKVIAFKGTKSMAKTLVAIHPGTQLKMQCNNQDYIIFQYREDGLLQSIKSSGKAKADWGTKTFSPTGFIKVGPTGHQMVKFQCS